MEEPMWDQPVIGKNFTLWDLTRDLGLYQTRFVRSREREFVLDSLDSIASKIVT